MARLTRIKLTSPDTFTVYDTAVTPGLGISSGSMSLEEILCDTELEFGAYNSNKFEVQMYGLENDVSGYTIEVWDEATPGVANRKYIFKGIIDSATTDNSNVYRQIVAYDKMFYVRDVDVAAWWENYWDRLPEPTTEGAPKTTTMSALRETLTGYVGLDVVVTTLPNDTLTITKFTSFTSVKFGTLLKMICEVQCCFPNINRRGYMEYVQLGTTATSLSDKYDTKKCQFEDYTTKLITGINVFSSSDSLVQSYGTEGNCYPISGNIFLLSLDATALQSALQVMYNAISSIQYVPAVVPLIISDYEYHLGQKISTDRGVHYILNQSLSGSVLIDQTLNSPAYGEGLNQQASPVNNEIIQGKKNLEIEQSVRGLTTKVSDLDVGLTRVTQTAEGLTVEVTDVEGRTLTLETTVNGLTIRDPSTGVTLIDGGKIETDNLYLNRLFPRNGSINNFVEMQDAGLSFMLGQSGFIYIGYAEPSGLSGIKLPYMKLGLASDQQSNIGAALVKRYANGIWIGNDTDLSSTTIGPGSTGLYIDMVENIVYKVVDGDKIPLADLQTTVATFG